MVGSVGTVVESVVVPKKLWPARRFPTSISRTSASSSSGRNSVSPSSNEKDAADDDATLGNAVAAVLDGGVPVGATGEKLLAFGGALIFTDPVDVIVLTDPVAVISCSSFSELCGGGSSVAIERTVKSSASNSMLPNELVVLTSPSRPLPLFFRSSGGNVSLKPPRLRRSMTSGGKSRF